MLRIKLFLFSLLLFQFGLAQQKIEGYVLDNDNNSPVVYASIILENGSGFTTDTTGKFSFILQKPNRLSDSVVFSAIGYAQTKTTVKELLKNKLVVLEKTANNLEQVKVFTSLKGDYRNFGYFRSWNVYNKGGEIGYIFDLPQNEFQLGIVQVKISHNFDTCRVKLHLREVAESGNPIPGNEILENDFVVMTTEKNGLLEFDLNWKEIRMPSNKIFVGFELLDCCCSASATPSFFYMGNEKGQNYYKVAKHSEWKSGADYSIYVRMQTK
jgi:hypothetical protein